MNTPLLEGTPTSAESLEQQLADAHELLAQLRQRRSEDLQRLAEVTRARDLLESNAAQQLQRVADAEAKLKANEKLMEALEQRLGAGRFSNAPGSNQQGAGDKHEAASPTQHAAAERLWLRQTLRMARRARRQGRLADAQALFDAALILRRTPQMWTELAHILREQELFASAEQAYDEALKTDPNNAENIFLAGYCAEKSGKQQRAARRYEEALGKDPKLVDRYEHLRDFNKRLFS